MVYRNCRRKRIMYYTTLHYTTPHYTTLHSTVHDIYYVYTWYTGIAGEKESYDFGYHAGFYVNATEAPWNKNYHMYSYITDELTNILLLSCNSCIPCIAIHSIYHALYCTVLYV